MIHEPPFENSDSHRFLTLYNRKPTALKEGSQLIRSYSPESNWTTVATLPYNMRELTVVSLDSGDLLIIGFQCQPDEGDCHEKEYYDGVPAEINKLHNGTITRIGQFSKAKYNYPMTELRIGSKIYFVNWQPDEDIFFMHNIELDADENIFNMSTPDIFPTVNKTWDLYAVHSVPGTCIL